MKWKLQLADKTWEYAFGLGAGFRVFYIELLV